MTLLSSASMRARVVNQGSIDSTARFKVTRELKKKHSQLTCITSVAIKLDLCFVLSPIRMSYSQK